MVPLAKNKKNKIYPEFARRLWEIIKQYESAGIEKHEMFETTLYVCALQNLLTQFRDADTTDVEKNDLPIWGLEPVHVEKFPADDEKNLGTILHHLRDILSHPNEVKNYLVYESLDQDNNVVAYEFRRTKNFKMTIPIGNLRFLVCELSKYLGEK